MAPSMRIKNLRCGQLALGMVEAKEKAKEFKKLSHKKLKKEMKENPVSVVISPEGDAYLCDGHHQAMAAWFVGIPKVHVKILKDFSHSHLSKKAFWHYMKTHRCVHLYDQFGNGPHPPLYLPQDVRGLGDDPYRSLAWLVQQSGAITKAKIRFADFIWANYFRRHKILHDRVMLDCKEDFQPVLAKAVRLARSPAARKLPGYTGPSRPKT